MDRGAQRDRRIAGRYRLRERVGAGGTGRVWGAHDEVLGREVALKHVKLPASLGAEARERSLREARAAARISSPNVVQVFDVVVDSGEPWIVMERVAGRGLDSVLGEQRRLQAADVVRLGQDVVRALAAAHAQGVVHRDVTPGNVLVRTDGSSVLTDFGIAVVGDDVRLTAAGTVPGSPDYLAPERLTGAAANPGTDLWALGCLLYAAAYGRSPFHRGERSATVRAIQHEEPALPGDPLTPVLRGLLAKNPALRLSAETTRLMLLAAAAGLARQTAVPVDVQPAPGPARARQRAPRRRRGLALAAAAVVLAGAGVTGVVTGGEGQPPPQAAGSAPASTTGAAEPSAPSADPDPPVSSPDRETVPEGFRLHQDETGFVVAVPADWTVSRDGSRIDFVEPGGGRFLRIDQTQTPKPDPVADWQQQEADVSVRLGGYSRIRIEPVDYREYDAADWEFTWQADSGALHVLNRNTITGPDRAYALYWSTPEGEWTDSLSTFDVIAQTFQPAG